MSTTTNILGGTVHLERRKHHVGLFLYVYIANGSLWYSKRDVGLVLTNNEAIELSQRLYPGAAVVYWSQPGELALKLS